MQRTNSGYNGFGWPPQRCKAFKDAYEAAKAAGEETYEFDLKVFTLGEAKHWIDTLQKYHFQFKE